MTTSAAAIATLTSAEFQNEVYGTVSVATRLAAAVTNRAHVMRVALYLHRTNRSVKSLLDLVDDILSGKRTVELTDQAATPQKMQELADNIEYLVRIMEYQYEAMRRVRLTNNSLTAQSLQTFHSNMEPLKDLADWIDVSAKPEEIDSVFARAKAETERGEIYELKRIE